MCLTCNCGEPENDHDDDRNIIMADLVDAAEAADISLQQAVENIATAVGTPPNGTTPGPNANKSLLGGPRVIRKSFVPVEVKVLSEAEGLVRATVSVVGNVDRAKDRIMPGAFGKAFEVANERGVLPTVVFGHQWDDIHQVLGSVKAWEELAPGSTGLPPQLQSKGFGGLNVDVQFNLEVPAGQIAFSHLSGKHLSQWSFAFETDDEGWAEKGVREIKSIREIHEVSLVLVGMNQDTVTSQIKALLPSDGGYLAAVKAFGQTTTPARSILADAVLADFKSKLDTQAQREGAKYSLKDDDGNVKFPINDCADCEDAWGLRGTSSIPKEKVEAYIKRTAKKLNCDGPWNDGGKAAELGETKGETAADLERWEQLVNLMGDVNAKVEAGELAPLDARASLAEQARTLGLNDVAAIYEEKDGGMPVLDGDEAMHNQPLADADAAIKLLLHQEIEEGEAAGVLPLAFIWCDLQRWAQQEADEGDSYYRFSAALDDLNARRKDYEVAVAEPAAEPVVQPPPPADVPQDRPSFQFLREVFADGSNPSDEQIKEAYQRTLQAAEAPTEGAEQPPETEEESRDDPDSTEPPLDNVVQLGVSPKVIRLAAAMAAASARN